MSKLQPVRGTSDLLPADMARHRFVVDNARSTSIRYGFQEMATPIFEFTDVFSRPLGASSDVVTKETYSFEDRGGERITLRPENTAGVVRAMISGGLTQSLPLKFFYAGPMFRYERPQKGRMRQFHQVGIEYLGPTDALADAEIIACGARVLADIGVLDKCVLHLNSLGDSQSRLAYRTALVDYLGKHEDALTDDSKHRLVVNPLRILDSKDAGDRQIVADSPRLQDHLNDVSKVHFETLIKALDAASIVWEFDPLLVRGLDYYCHTAFEFITDALGTQGTVLGGGRYDSLSEMLGGPAIAGVGWAAGIERLAMLANEGKIAIPQLAVVAADSDSNQSAFQLAETLRDAGFSVELPITSNMGKKMKKLDKAGIKIAVILGGDEIERNVIQLRNLVDGTQDEVARDALVGVLADMAGNTNTGTILFSSGTIRD